MVVRVVPVVIGAVVLVWSAASWSSASPGILAAFTVAFAAVWAVSLRLTRGEVVNIDVSIGLASALVLPVQAAVLASLVGCVVGGIADRRNRRDVRHALGVALSRPIPVVAAGGIFAFLGRPDAANHQALFVAAALAAGTAYLILDAIVLAPTRGGEQAGPVGALRPLGTLYLGHVSIGIVLGLLFPWMGLISLLVLTLLVLVMQNSYSLYLRTRVAYQETIGVLALASELQTPGSSGHAQRVADAAAAVGKQFRLPSRFLETLNYAALLHDIGRIGLEGETLPHERDSHAHLGAEMVQSIPFLAAARPIILHHHDYEQSSPDLDEYQRLGAYVVGICCEYDHLRCADIPHDEALRLLESLHSDRLALRVLAVLGRVPLGQPSLSER